ncbi:aminotransferase class IV [Rhodoferax sp.]|uniref:aminotransferase class IV n=1 Tax=Rhodoferax sp. TaxID=50421 RepID=UPI002637DE90|nr:aminotransferase class IV [Rhodoferax sp.]MDD2924473.1 aminotransferase class IV [Rhodoferax sp.]
MTPTQFPDGMAFVQGRYVPIAEAAIPITDWGFLRSDATYDVVTVWDGAFFRLEAHLERFLHSCQRWRLDPGLNAQQITEVLSQCVRLSGLRSSYVEMICTRGQPAWGSRDPRQAVNQFYAFAVPYVWIANAEQRDQGLHLKISEVQRIPSTSVDPRAKNYHWNDLTMGLLDALDAGADSVLLVDAQGNVVEGPGFNVFCLRHGALITPDAGMLEGITRRTVIEIAQSRGMTPQLRPLPADELRHADEVFITTSGGGILPVTRVDQCQIGDGRPGPITRQLIQTYWDWHQNPAYSLAIDYSR